MQEAQLDVGEVFKLVGKMQIQIELANGRILQLVERIKQLEQANGELADKLKLAEMPHQEVKKDAVQSN